MKLDISKKITLTYIIIAVSIVLSSLFSFYVLSKSKQVDKELRYVSIPSLESIKELKALMTEVKKLTNSWIFISNKGDKNRLAEITKTNYNQLSNKLDSLASKWTDAQSKTVLDSINENNKAIITAAVDITKVLATDDDYSNDAKVDHAISINKKNVNSLADANDLRFIRLIGINQNNLETLHNTKEALFSKLTIILILMLLLVIAVSLYSMRFAKQSVTSPLLKLSNVISEVAKGNVNSINKSDREDEIGLMQNAISDMVDGLKQKVEFSAEIGKGNYQAELKGISEEDKLGNALVQMRNNLKIAAAGDFQRNWTATGLAELAIILRENYTDEKLFYNTVNHFLIKYCKANQGALFVLNEDKDSRYIELVSCFAYDKKKFLEKRIEIGEGLVGQCFVEKDFIYLTDVPESYTHITSGLGEATARCVVLVPLLVNENINGVIELASFTPLETFEVEFLKKAAESLSSTISSLKVNLKTARLLEQTNLQAEGMKAQEEEMRQNLEEMQATQEDFLQKEQNYIREISTLKSKLQIA